MVDANMAAALWRFYLLLRCLLAAELTQDREHKGFSPQKNNLQFEVRPPGDDDDDEWLMRSVVQPCSKRDRLLPDAGSVWCWGKDDRICKERESLYTSPNSEENTADTAGNIPE